LQRTLVEQHDIAAAVADEATPLQSAGCQGHAFAPHTEHQRENFMRQKKFARGEPVARHQQGSRQTLRHRVVVDADGLLRQLAQARFSIAAQYLTQTTALLQVLLQDGSRHAKGPPGSLHAAIESGVLQLKHRRGVEHPFAAHLRHRHVGGSGHGQQNRDKAFNGKPDIP
jgi:hypothetical protein